MSRLKDKYVLYKNIHYFDIPVLLGAGFSFSTLSEHIMWGKDKEGTSWQVTVEGERAYFHEQLPSGARLGKRQMDRDEFHQRFM